MIKKLFNYLNRTFTADNEGEIFKTAEHVTIGVVVDTDDPLQNGRLRVFCPSLGDNPKKVQQLPWALYSSPYAGTVNNDAFARGNYDGKSTSTGSVSFGFWGIPDLGSNVLVICIDGDSRRRVWIGCIYDQQQTHTLSTGRYDWGNNSAPDGPLSGNKTPINPTYENLHTAFNNDISSAEWKSRGADYQLAAVPKYNGTPPTPDTVDALDDTYDEIREREKYEWVKGILGTNGYDWSAFKNISGVMASRAFGLSTPGFHSLTMDDRPFNTRIKMRSTAGKTILLDDTNERLYITTGKGNNYIEMDENGDIDIFSNSRISFHSTKDMNFSADTLRFSATSGIYMYSGDSYTTAKLTDNPRIGEIRIQASNDLSTISKNFRGLTYEDTIFEVGKDEHISIGGNYNTQVQNNINIVTNSGDYNLTIANNGNMVFGGSLTVFSGETFTASSTNSARIYSLTKDINIGAGSNVAVKAFGGNIVHEAVSGGGIVILKSQNSQIGISSSGTQISTNGTMSISSGGDFTTQNGVQSQQTPTLPPNTSITVPCNLVAPVPIIGFTGADLVARVAFNAGFRDAALVTVVAISGAESEFNPATIGDVTLVDIEWGQSIGLWQIRSLNNPQNYPIPPDSLRVKSLLFDPQYNANTAYRISGRGVDFGPWTTYRTRAYLGSLFSTAKIAVENMCSGLPPLTIMANKMAQNNTLIPLTLSAQPAGITLRNGNMQIQSDNDIEMASTNSGMSTKMFGNIIPSINNIGINIDTLKRTTQASFAQTSGIIGSTISFAPSIINTTITDLRLPINFPTIPNLNTNYLPEAASQIFLYNSMA